MLRELLAAAADWCDFECLNSNIQDWEAHCWPCWPPIQQTCRPRFRLLCLTLPSAKDSIRGRNRRLAPPPPEAALRHQHQWPTTGPPRLTKSQHAVVQRSVAERTTKVVVDWPSSRSSRQYTRGGATCDCPNCQEADVRFSAIGSSAVKDSHAPTSSSVTSALTSVRSASSAIPFATSASCVPNISANTSRRTALAAAVR